MSDTEKLSYLIQVLKSYAERLEYDVNYGYPEEKWQCWDDGADFGNIFFARSLLERIGETFLYPMASEEK